MTGSGAISACIVWSARYQGWQNYLGLALTCLLFTFCCWLLFHSAILLVKFFGQTGINVIIHIMGLLLMSLGIEFIVTGTKAVFSGLLGYCTGNDNAGTDLES